MTKQNTTHDLLSGPIMPTLKKMTIQVMYGMVMLMSFNLADTFFIGLLGTEPLAAVSFTFPVTFTLVSLTIGLGIGTSAVIARFIGSGEGEQAKEAGTAAIYLSLLLVCLLAIAGYYSITPIFTLLGASEDLLPIIHEYMEIWLIGAVLLTLPMVGNSVLRASGDTKTPSFIMALGGVINAALDPVLIFGLGPIPAMGVQGAAIASVLGWGVGGIIIIRLLVFKRRLVLALPSGGESFSAHVKSVLKIGLPASGANMLTPIAMAFMTAIVAGYGNPAVAAFGVGSRIESLASMVVLALSMTLPPFISQNYGANHLSRIKQAYQGVLKFVLIWQLAVYLVLVLSAGLIAAAFGDDLEVQRLIVLFIYIMPLGYGLQGVIILSNSSFNALHKPLHALGLSVARLFVFFVPISYLCGHFWGIEGLFAGGVLANLITAAIAYRVFMTQFQCLDKPDNVAEVSS